MRIRKAVGGMIKSPAKVAEEPTPKAKAPKPKTKPTFAKRGPQDSNEDARDRKGEKILRKYYKNPVNMIDEARQSGDWDYRAKDHALVGKMGPGRRNLKKYGGPR
jgi:hypothetical protein